MPQHTLDTISAINILKAEILSPDWALSPRRNANCMGAVNSLNLFFHDRRYAKGLTAIARQVLFHLEDKKNVAPNVIDLFKEISAHIVTIFEQDKEDTLTEKKVCARSLNRFKKLDIQIKPPGEINQFALANSSLKQDVTELQALAPQFTTLSATKQIQAMLTLQTLIAETKALQKVMTPPS